MRILITGATGFIGQDLCHKLLIAGHELTVITRDTASAQKLLPYPARFFAWENDGALPAAALEGVQAIVHLAGESVAQGRWSEAKKKRILESRIKMAQALSVAVEKAGTRPVLVAASAIGFYGERGDETLTESSQLGQGFLSEVCLAWEEGLARIATHCSRAVVFRVGIVLGRNGGALDRMLPPFRAGVAGPLSSGRQWMSWIHRDDMLSLLATALTNPRYNGVINATAPHPVTNKAFTQALAYAVAMPAVIPTPGFALRALFGEVADELLASHRVLPERAMALGFTFRFPDIDGALKDLISPPGENYFVAHQFVERPLSEVFPFFSDAKNLEAITPPWLSFHVLGDTGAVHEGMLINYKLKVHGVPVRWQSRIESYLPPHRFVDTQIKGPYSLWHHTHLFHEIAGGTLMEDIVRYKLPLGLVGSVAGGAFVRRDVTAIFQYRKDAIASRFNRKV